MRPLALRLLRICPRPAQKAAPALVVGPKSLNLTETLWVGSEMKSYEYKVIPAPRRGEKAKGAKSGEDRFALALMRVMNELGAEGWEYLRADTLPCDERAGLTGIKTSYMNMLIFRRPLTEAAVAAPAAPAMDADQLRAFNALRVVTEADTASAGRSLGAPNAPAGTAPPVGPARPDHAAE